MDINFIIIIFDNNIFQNTNLRSNLTLFSINLRLFFVFIFCFLLQRSKFWIELLDLSDSLKYFIPSEPISLSIPNIYSKERKKGLEKMELIRYFR